MQLHNPTFGPIITSATLFLGGCSSATISNTSTNGPAPPGTTVAAPNATSSTSTSSTSVTSSPTAVSTATKSVPPGTKVLMDQARLSWRRLRSSDLPKWQQQLKKLPAGSDPQLSVRLDRGSGLTNQAVQAIGGRISTRVGKTVFVDIPARSVGKLLQLPSVESIRLTWPPWPPPQCGGRYYEADPSGLPASFYTCQQNDDCRIVYTTGCCNIGHAAVNIPAGACIVHTGAGAACDMACERGAPKPKTPQAACVSGKCQLAP